MCNYMLIIFIIYLFIFIYLVITILIICVEIYVSKADFHSLILFMLSNKKQYSI